MEMGTHNGPIADLILSYKKEKKDQTCCPPLILKRLLAENGYEMS